MSLQIKEVNYNMIEILKALLTGKNFCISVPNTEQGRMISAFIDNYIKEHPDEFDKCLVFDEKSSSK